MRRGFRPAGFLPAAGNRRWAFSLPGKTEAVREPAPGNNRVRARLGADTNPVRELPAAGARACAAGRSHKRGARIARRRRACVRGWAKPQTRRANCPPQVCPPQARAFARPQVQEPGFFPTWENRSRARARTRNQPRACETRERKKTRCATCSPQVCPPQACFLEKNG